MMIDVTGIISTSTLQLWEHVSYSLLDVALVFAVLVSLRFLYSYIKKVL